MALVQSPSVSLGLTLNRVCLGILSETLSYHCTFINLAFGLAVGLAVGLANLITTTTFIPKEWLFIIIAIIVIAEVIFWCFDKSKAKKGESILVLTAKRKLFAFAEAFYWVINLLGAIGLIIGGSKIINPIILFFASYGLSILEVLGIGVLIVIGIMAYIYLNSLKFRIKKK